MRLHRHEQVATIVYVFAVPAQCQAHHGECRNNVYDPKQNTFARKSRLPFRGRDQRVTLPSIKARLRFLV